MSENFLNRNDLMVRVQKPFKVIFISFFLPLISLSLSLSVCVCVCAFIYASTSFLLCVFRMILINGFKGNRSENLLSSSVRKIIGLSVGYSYSKLKLNLSGSFQPIDRSVYVIQT